METQPPCCWQAKPKAQVVVEQLIQAALAVLEHVPVVVNKVRDLQWLRFRRMLAHAWKRRPDGVSVYLLSSAPQEDLEARNSKFERISRLATAYR